MYQKPFFIEEPIGNNAFSFDERKNKRLYVPSIKTISSFSEIQLGEEIVFEERDEHDTLMSCKWLKNLYQFEWNNIPVYLVDNHNHVFYFWYLARKNGFIWDNCLLYHIDEHADTRDPWKYLLKPDSYDMEKVFEFTNYFLNVGNYIIPAEKEGIVWKTVQIRSESALEEYIDGDFGDFEQDRDIILNLDLDFFSPGLDYIDYSLKKKVIQDIAQKSQLITLCTSPYFINQQRALDVFIDIFS